MRLRSIRPWRADTHTGIGVLSSRVPYSYEPLARPLRSTADVFRVVAEIGRAPDRLTRRVYYVTAHFLDAFVIHSAEFAARVVDVDQAERIIDIRPTTTAAALDELAAFKTTRLAPVATDFKGPIATFDVRARGAAARPGANRK